MREEHLSYLVCPLCKKDLILFQVQNRINSLIERGTLKCSQCTKEYKIVNYIPRFVLADNYSKGFSFQWAKHAKTQYDSFNGITISQTRLFKEKNGSEN